MNNNILGIIVSIIYIGAIILISNVFAQKSKETSRKFIHIMLANWWIIAMYYIDNFWYAAALPFLFIFVNYFSYKYDIIKSMERDEGGESTPGTVYYAISLLAEVILCYGFGFSKYAGLAGIAIMGYGDGMAAIIGKAINSKEYHFLRYKKTLAGSTAMFVISMIITTLVLNYLGVEYIIMKAIFVSIVATVAESLSLKGTDNLTVPILTTSMILLCI